GFDDNDSTESETAIEQQARIQRDLVIHAQHTIVDHQGIPHLATTISATNTGSRPIEAEAGIWVWFLRAYATAERTGSPVWRFEDQVQSSGVPDLGRRFVVPADATVT